jgi:hypothetical protein
MKDAAIRRPAGAAILHAGLPAVSLRSTAGFIPSRPSALRRVATGTFSAPAARRNKAATKAKSVVPARSRLSCRRPACSAPEACRNKAATKPKSVVLARLHLSCRRPTGSAPEARRNKARSEAKRNFGRYTAKIYKTPDKGWRRTRRYRYRSSNCKPCARRMTLNSSRYETVR